MNMVNWMMMMKRCLNLQKCDAEHPLSAFSLSLGHSEHGKPSHESVSVSQLFHGPTPDTRFSALAPPPENPGTKTRKHAAMGKRHVLRTVRNCVHRAHSRRFQPTGGRNSIKKDCADAPVARHKRVGCTCSTIMLNGLMFMLFHPGCRNKEWSWEWCERCGRGPPVASTCDETDESAHLSDHGTANTNGRHAHCPSMNNTCPIFG